MVASQQSAQSMSPRMRLHILPYSGGVLCLIETWMDWRDVRSIPGRGDQSIQSPVCPCTIRVCISSSKKSNTLLSSRFH